MKLIIFLGFIFLISIYNSNGFMINNINTIQKHVYRSKVWDPSQCNKELSPSYSKTIRLFSTTRNNQLNANQESIISTPPIQTEDMKKRKNLIQRVKTSIILAILGTLWIFSGSYSFTLGFFLLSFLGIKEYDAIAKAINISIPMDALVIPTFLCYLISCVKPSFHQFVLPLSSINVLISLLRTRSTAPTLYEISLAIFGIFYLGYLPSFWIRVLNHFKSLSLIATWNFLPQGRIQIPYGPLLIWWTVLSISFSDMGAYFIGMRFGKNKLSKISPSVGACSPNKTIEGALGGLFFSSLISTIGAYLMRWPFWIFTGISYGIILSLVALLGDLTASMLKRTAKVKDSGTIFPGHGGVLDRMDSYIFTAPVVYFLCILVSYLTSSLNSSP